MEDRAGFTEKGDTDGRRFEYRTEYSPVDTAATAVAPVSAAGAHPFAGRLEVGIQDLRRFSKQIVRLERLRKETINPELHRGNHSFLLR